MDLATQGVHPATEVAAPALIKVIGECAGEHVTTLVDIRTLPVAHLEAEAKACQDAPGPHTYRGVWLRELLRRSVPALQTTHPLVNVGNCVRVDARDGHSAVFAYCDLLPAFGNQQVLVAYEMDGAPLDGTGVQLVVPHDRAAARWVKDIVAIWVGKP